jgi:hypothetical protein
MPRQPTEDSQQKIAAHTARQVICPEGPVCSRPGSINQRNQRGEEKTSVNIRPQRREEKRAEQMTAA